MIYHATLYTIRYGYAYKKEDSHLLYIDVVRWHVAYIALHSIDILEDLRRGPRLVRVERRLKYLRISRVLISTFPFNHSYIYYFTLQHHVCD
jgi:hypothetical protein